MMKRIAMLLSAITLAVFAHGADPSSMVELVPTQGSGLTPAVVSSLAAANATAANLIQSELRSLSASIDRDEPKQIAQFCLMQRVLDNLTCHERQRTAAQALTLYFQLVALEQQKPLLSQSLQTIEQLIRLADKADELGIKDGNRPQLEDQRLQVTDQQLVADGATLKLRIALAELIAKSRDEMLSIPIVFLAPSDQDLESASSPLTLEQSFIDAKSHRCDLKAIDEMCRSLNDSNLIAAKQLLGAIQSGLGLAIAATSRLSLLTALHYSDQNTNELRYRRQQCHELRTARQSQAETQVHVAFVDHQTAIKRLHLVKQQLNNVETSLQQARKAIELDQAKPGTDLLADLERLQLQGRYLERQSAVSIARVKLDESTGSLQKN